MGKKKWPDVQPGRPGDDVGQSRPQTRRPQAGEVLVLHPCETQVSWYLTHYVGSRTRPCLGKVCSCQRSDVRITTRWVGWVLAIDKATGRLVLAQLTAGCWETCRDLRDENLNLRTCELILRRLGSRPNGKVEAYVKREHHKAHQIPELPFTHKDQLMRVWFAGAEDYLSFNQTQELLDALGGTGPRHADGYPEEENG